ncbi:LBP / BPI / CETP family protein [Ancylostoma caninum]|uniref:LBP / BPI / CETP family protein n=1 Tax=Ancylostoma caninum TaxID=29170 RepID=A0A368GJM2_ANCCA|nr:LBP / BPI / CETP family protein [Ancylostoma caninum]
MTGHRLHTILFALVVGILAVPNSNLKARINLSAFKFVSEHAKHVLDLEVPNIILPNVTKDFTAGYGTGKVSVQGLKITEFQSPKFNFFPTANGVSWSSKGGSLKLTGKWAAEYRMLIPIWSSGWVNVKTSDIRLNVTGKVEALNHRPQIHLGDCEAEVGSFHIELGGGMIPRFTNLFRSVISLAIKNAIRYKACETSRSVILAEVNDHILSLPLHLQVWKNFYVDYAVEKSPIFTSSYVEAEAAAETVYENQTCTSPKIQEWTEKDLAPRMAVMWIGESIPNCLLSSAHEGKLIAYTLTKDTPSVSSYLKTSCSIFSLSLCIGHFFPKLHEDYPNQHVDLHFHSHKAPVIQFTNDTIKVNSTFAVDFHVYPMEDHPKSLARLLVVTSSSLRPEIVDNKLRASVVDTENHFLQDFSDIGIFSNTFLFMFGKIFAMTSNAITRWVVTEGFPIPIFDNVTISGKVLLGWCKNNSKEQILGDEKDFIPSSPTV